MVTPSRKAFPYELHKEIFVKLNGTWLHHGRYGVYMAIMGSIWLLRGLYAALTRMLPNLYVYTLQQPHISRNCHITCTCRPCNYQERSTSISISWKQPYVAFMGMLYKVWPWHKELNWSTQVLKRNSPGEKKQWPVHVNPHPFTNIQIMYNEVSIFTGARLRM